MPRNGNKGLGYKNIPGVTRDSKHTYIPLDSAKGHAFWTIQCVIALVGFLKPHVPGDGHKYKPAVLRDAATFLNKILIKGGPKAWKSVRDKISDLMAIYQAVLYLKTNVSGLTWDDDLGMNIGPETEGVWQGIFTAKPICTPFRNRGWPVFDDVAELDPEKPKGSHAFRPTTGQQGVIDASQSDESSFQSQGPSDDSHLGRESPPWPENLFDSAPDDISQPQETGSDNVTGGSSVSQNSSLPSLSTPARSSHKRSAPPSTTQPPSKRLKPNLHAEAIHGLSGALDRFGEKFKEGTQALADAINASPERGARTRKVRDVLQEKEGWLSARERIELGNKFVDPRTADTYLYYASLGSPDRKAWIEIELEDLKK